MSAKPIPFGPSIEERAAKTVQDAEDFEDWLTIPNWALYGHLGDIARSMHTPLGWSYNACITIAAGIEESIIKQSFFQQTNLYSFVIGPPQDGKSSTIRRAIHAMTGSPKGSLRTTNRCPVSDRGIIEAFPAETEPTLRSLRAPAYLLQLDEASVLLEKCGIQGSTLPQALCTLYNDDSIHVSDKKGSHEAYVMLSILGALVVRERSESFEHFGASSTQGLYSRCIIGPPAKPGWDLGDAWEPSIPVNRPVCVTKIPEAVYAIRTKWRKEGEALKKVRNRLVEIALRVAIITSAYNKEEIVSAECMRSAISFAAWQEKVQERYNASEAKNEDAKLTEVLLTEFEKYRDANGKPVWFTYRKVQNSHKKISLQNKLTWIEHIDRDGLWRKEANAN